MAATMTGEDVTLAVLGGSPRRHRKEALVRAAFFSAAALSIVISLAIVASLVGRAVDFALAVDPGALWTSGWFPRRGLYDLRTVISGTLIVSLIGMLVAAPLGVGAAIYLSEYARPRVRRWLKPIIETLAGIPSVVIEYFALNFISPEIVQRLYDRATIFNLAAAGIGVGILTVPLVATVAEDALHAVPQSLREASYGLGARRRLTCLRVVVPAAVSGLVAALILGLSRAIGETMVVAIAGGGTGSSPFHLSPFQPGQTMTAAMTALATGSDRVNVTTAALNPVDAMFFIGMLLFLFTFALNVVSERFVRRVRRRY